MLALFLLCYDRMIYMIDDIKKAKIDKTPLVFKKYKVPDITWEDIMIFVYNQSTINSDDLRLRAEKAANRDALDYIGNILIQSKFWLAPQAVDLFDIIPGASDLLFELNDKVDTSKCSYYSIMQHNCSSDWHFQGIRMSLSNRHVPDHHDPYDIFYWQILGTSFWTIDKDVTYTLEPGDLLYLPHENSHAVNCDGPRAGLLIDNLNKMI